MKSKAKVKKALPMNRKTFVDALNQFAAHGYSRWNVFDDFITVAAISIANNSDPYCIANTKATIDEREQRYLNIIGKYKPQCQQLFPTMFAAIVNEMQTYAPEHMHDVLGELFHELDFQDDWKGQFFTPQVVCDAMGILNLDSQAVKAAIDDKGFVTLNEPCCGGGALILGAANGLTKLGINPCRRMLTIANDLDERCVLMCYIQLSLYGLPAIVFQQNTLTQETLGEPWFTPIYIFDGWTLKSRRAFKQDTTPVEPVKAEPVKIKSEATRIEPVEPQQLTLF